ncbi:MAG: hypothetical protein GF393_03130 [Armatimonadia bacterium]|nr:hypothetical protein [Armatimonadia bacterium]
MCRQLGISLLIVAGGLGVVIACFAAAYDLRGRRDLDALLSQYDIADVVAAGDRNDECLFQDAHLAVWFRHLEDDEGIRTAGELFGAIYVFGDLEYLGLVPCNVFGGNFRPHVVPVSEGEALLLSYDHAEPLSRRTGTFTYWGTIHLLSGSGMREVFRKEFEPMPVTPEGSPFTVRTHVLLANPSYQNAPVVAEMELLSHPATDRLVSLKSTRLWEWVGNDRFVLTATRPASPRSGDLGSPDMSNGDQY